MTGFPTEFILNKDLHPWLHTINLSFVPGPMTPVLQEVADGMLREFARIGHNVQETPDNSTDVIFTTAPFGKSLGWREALIFNARRRFNLHTTPTFYTIVQISPDEFQRQIDHFAAAIKKPEPDPADFEYEGLAPEAYKVLYEQGVRGGPILALERLVQAQAKSIRILLLIADERPIEMYHFDLVGASPHSSAENLDEFYEDIVLRITTTMSTIDVNQHQVVGEPVTLEQWNALPAREGMVKAGYELGVRNFFTDTVRIADIVTVPAVSDSVAEQYSEGCFATWETELNALIATVTGSARPIYKGAITEDDLAIIVGVKDDRSGALVLNVEGRPNDPPSSEAVELIDMDSLLPKIELGEEWGISGTVPVVRSKLHGHRGIRAYDPCCVEYAPLDEPYFKYPVSCATNAQAQGIKSAFSRAESLLNPDDPRQVAFTILPGHGVVITEKWVPGKEPFQVIWEYIDAGYLDIASIVPQGEVIFLPGPAGKYYIKPD
jgi:hypothetical protein